MLNRVILLFAFALAFSASGADVERFEMLKGRHYFQISEGAAQIQTNNAFRFAAQAYATVPGNVTGGNVTTSKGNRVFLQVDGDGDPYLFRDRFDEPFPLDNNYPNGAFTFVIQTLHDGTRSLPLSLNGDAYPNGPAVNNLAALNGIAYNAYNEISWQPFVGGAATDFIQLQIEEFDGDNVWETPDFGEPGALNGLATRTILRPGDLKAGVSYIASLRFIRVQANSSSAYPGAVGVVGYYAVTEFMIKPAATGLIPTVDRVQIWKEQRYEQLSQGGPVAQGKPFEFFVRGDAVTTGQITSMTVTPPASTAKAMLPNNNLTEFLFSDEAILDPTVFRNTYREGVYVLNVGRQNNSGLQVNINFGLASFPPVPNLQGLAAYDPHDPRRDMVVSWAPWTGGGERDFIRVELEDELGKVFETSSFASENHLLSSATSTVIPAATFAPGHVYRLTVTFHRVNVVDTTSVPGAFIFGGYSSRTRFDFESLPPDVTQFGITHARHIWQRGENAFEPDQNAPFVFEATARGSASGRIRSAMVTPPGRRPLSLTSTNNLEYKLSDVEMSAELLAGQYGAGAYTFRFDSVGDGVRTTTLNQPTLQFPPTPQVRNFSTLATILRSSDFEITWLPWANANPNTDSIEFTLTDWLGDPVPLGVSFDVTSTNAPIFRNTLFENLTYTARLRFTRTLRSETLQYPGARGSATLVSETAFYISTVHPTRRFTNSSLTLNSSQQLQFKITGPLVGRAYRLDRSLDLPNWVPLQTNSSSGPDMLFTLPANLPRAFYRTVLLP